MQLFAITSARLSVAGSGSSSPVCTPTSAHLLPLQRQAGVGELWTKKPLTIPSSRHSEKGSFNTNPSSGGLSIAPRRHRVRSVLSVDVNGTSQRANQVRSMDLRVRPVKVARRILYCRFSSERTASWAKMKPRRPPVERTSSHRPIREVT